MVLENQKICVCLRVQLFIFIFIFMFILKLFRLFKYLILFRIFLDFSQNFPFNFFHRTLHGFFFFIFFFHFPCFFLCNCFRPFFFHIHYLWLLPVQYATTPVPAGLPNGIKPYLPHPLTCPMRGNRDASQTRAIVAICRCGLGERQGTWLGPYRARAEEELEVRAFQGKDGGRLT